MAVLTSLASVHKTNKINTPLLLYRWGFLLQVQMNRRKFLLASASTITAVSLAGCMNNTIEEYPDGLSEEGIEDVDALFGPESPYLNSESVKIDISTERENTTTETTIRVNAEQENSFVKTVDTLPEDLQNSGKRTVVRYHTGQTRYERVVTDADGQESSPTYRKSQNQFTKNVEFYSNFLTELFTDVEFSNSTITDEGLIQYEATEVGSDNSLSPDSESIEDVTMVVQFRENGLPESISATITAVQSGQQNTESDSESDESSETQEIVQNIEFSKYDSVEVSEPDWLDEADQQVEERRANQPSGNVTFSESTGGEVSVTIDSLENTESVDIVVDGSISDRSVEVGDTVTYDNPRSVQVISQTESGGIVRIDTYSP